MLTRIVRRERRRAGALMLIGALIGIGSPLVVVAPQPALATYSAPCVPNPGKDGPAGTMSAVSDVYFQPVYGTLPAGSTTISAQALDTNGGGASTSVTAGDELLIIQMQDGTFTYTNSSSYGTGAALSSAGLYEFVYVTAVNGATASIVGAGANGGTVNTYHEALATSTAGQETYQFIRVPQYTTGTLASGFHAAYWDGITGGVAAVDMASLLTLGSASVYATGDGFRGAAFTKNSTTPTAVLNNDYVDSAGMNGTGLPGFGSKGEGVFGTPGNLFSYTDFSTPSTPAGPQAVNSETDGYPGGDMGMGAPGNAGGGGDDDDASANDQNTGGGGGSNGGAGGKGGYPWTPNYSGATAEYSTLGVHTGTGYNTTNSGDIGGRGAAAINAAASATRLYMGGGGGAGVNNDGTNSNSYNAYGSSGGVGGGIIIMRLNTTSGSATLYANGTTGLAPLNDGGGGGGAGGTIVLAAPGTFSGVTLNVAGAAGTTANASNGTANQAHGPGGGGGGGEVLSTSAVTSTLTGGAAGTTTTGALTYGATAGGNGVSATINSGQIVGVQSAGDCTASTSSLYIGPVTYAANTGYSTTGQYDGVVPASIQNDFTAKAFFPTGSTMYNISTTPGNWNGNTFSTTASTTVNVANEWYYNNNPGAAHTVTFTATAPSGWTVRLCPQTTCAAATGYAIGAAAQQSTTTYAAAANTAYGPTTIYAVYTVPSGTSLQAYNRYDVPVDVSDNASPSSHNETHNELYPGFVALTKNETLPSNGGCPVGNTPPASGTCPGAIVLETIDYRNVVVGAASESGFPTAWPWTGSGSFTISDNGSATGLINSTNGSASSNSWGSTTQSCGLQDALTSGATVNGTTVFGDTTAGSVFTGATPVHTAGSRGSTSITDEPGGATFSLVPNGITATTGVGGATAATAVGSQGKLYFRFEIIPTGGC
jgi:hypothetical protein